TMDTKQITHHALQMDKFNREGNYGNIMPLLTALDNACVTCEQLQGTYIVRVFYRLLNTCSDHSVKNNCQAPVVKMEETLQPPLSHFKGEGKQRRIHCRWREYDSFELALRTKCIQLLLGALNPETSKEAEGKTAERRRTAKYKACIRGKVANLTNPKNGHLWFFPGMSVEEMANEELQRQLPKDLEGTPTPKLRCEGSDCRVTRMSRGTLFLPAWVRQATADQDAMTFVTCSRCGEQWYHSGWVCL
uniref:Transcription elongation factor A N-terminal and central domain containing n=1 Tax=Oncorhynchus mykiss TaxID=8022 RepID=A0A8K9V228_ONCMY